MTTCSLAFAATYPTIAEAKGAQKALRYEKRLRVSVYLCELCDAYHLKGNERDMRINPKAIKVLRLVAHGFTRDQIADELGITPRTVKWYIEELYFALGTNTRENLVAVGIGLGLVDPRTVVPMLKDPCQRAG